MTELAHPHTRGSSAGKAVFAQEQGGGWASHSTHGSGGVIISGGRVQNSVLSHDVRVNSYSEVHDSVIMERVNIGRHCRIKRAIIDKDVKIPSGTVIGYDPEEDRKRFTVSPGGVVVVAKGQVIT
jgi:glucose-1-phosphate adenylyltransferase